MTGMQVNIITACPKIKKRNWKNGIIILTNLNLWVMMIPMMVKVMK
jgi:ACR3 family arsenite efflux pump ArsB